MGWKSVISPLPPRGVMPSAVLTDKYSHGTYRPERKDPREDNNRGYWPAQIGAVSTNRAAR